MILIVSALFPPEPLVSANIAYDLATQLANEHEVVVASPKPTRPYGMTFESLPSFEHFEHQLLPSYTHPQSSVIGRFRESYSLGLHIKHFIECHHQKIEVVYANVWPLFAQLAVAQACKKYGIPFVIHVQDIYPESLTSKVPFVGDVLAKLLLPIDKYILTTADAIVAISNQMKDYLVSTRGVTHNKISLVRNWQNDRAFNNVIVNESNSSNFNFLYLGSISPSAGVELLITAFEKADLKSAVLTIAGNGSDKIKCINIAAGCKSTIKFIEAQPEHVASIQSCADVLLLPLKKGIAETALPSKMTAYMLSAKPIIASVDKPSEIASIIEDNGCGWVTAPEDIDELARAMKEAYETAQDRLSNIGANSLAFANANLLKEINLNLLKEKVKSLRRLT